MDYKSNRTLAESDAAIEFNGEYITPDQYEQQQREMMETLKGTFTKQRDDWIKHRSQSGVEKRMRMSDALYLGEESDSSGSSLEDTLVNGPRQKGRSAVTSAPRSKVVINIVRPKVDQAVARMCEILLPVDDRNWGIKPTPVPLAVSAMAGNFDPIVDPATGQQTQLSPNDQFQKFVKRMKDCAAAMEREIDDVLNQCQYNGEQRKLIENGVRLGTGCMLGPFPENSKARSWRPALDGTMKLEIKNGVVPASMSIDPWDVFFDPACGNDHQRGLGFYHRRLVTRREIRALKGVPGYDSEALSRVLLSKPTRTKVADGRLMRNVCEEDSYEMFVYYGHIEPEQMTMLTSSMGDPLHDVQDCVMAMIGDEIIGCIESWVQDGSLPLDVWCWRKSVDSPYGYSLPEELAHQSRVVIAAWRQVMDDAKFSIGGQLVLKKGQLIPTDGNYEIYPGKSWSASAEVDDVTKAMHMFEFTNHTQALLSIATAAMAFADQESSMPQIMGGDKGGAPETVGGMVMLYNNANGVLRMRVKLYDDCITGPHIRRHYDWQMAFNPKQEIKGDMEVDARGTTALLEKDIQNQATLNLANVTSNPRYQPFIDPKEELKVILKAFKVNPEDVMFTDDKIKQNADAAAKNPPQDPRILAAQMNLQGKQMDIQDRQQQRQSDMALAAEEMQTKRMQMAYNVERERADGEQNQAQMLMDREIAISKMQQDGILTQEEIASREKMNAINIDSKHQLFNAEAALRINTGAGI
jgi:hypothetical protein